MEDTLYKEEDELKTMIEECRALKAEVGTKNKTLKKMKEDLRVFMIDSGIKTFAGVEIRRSFSSLDLELLRLEEPDIFGKYCKYEERTIVTFDSTITKKNLEKIKEKHPTIWNDPDYRKEMTARLYGL